MSKRKNHPKKARKRSSRTKTPASAAITQSWWFKNAVALVFILIGGYLLADNAGYQRLQKVFSDFNHNKVQYGQATKFEKQHRYLGFNISFLEQVKQATPEDAVILFPPRWVLYPRNEKSPFGKWMDSKSYTTYFLYPRSVIYDNKKDRESALYPHATHVAVVRGWGYDKLNYPVTEQSEFGIYPVNQ
ncbi:MAG: hypothetical protein R3301_05030 [Saprospiraceae bacterium]|nr:hypothetical protein [Saprospiraceae bacterium]